MYVYFEFSGMERSPIKMNAIEQIDLLRRWRYKSMMSTCLTHSHKFCYKLFQSNRGGRPEVETIGEHVCLFTLMHYSPACMWLLCSWNENYIRCLIKQLAYCILLHVDGWLRISCLCVYVHCACLD